MSVESAAGTSSRLQGLLLVLAAALPLSASPFSATGVCAPDGLK
jgi:hypothetical protein